MTPWDVLIATTGGSAVLMGAVAWMVKSLVSQSLARTLNTQVAQLKSDSEKAVSELQAQLRMVALEHEVRYRKWHERRADVVSRLYGLLVEAQWAMGSFVSPGDFAGEPSKREKYAIAMNKTAAFFRYVDRRRIYLPPAVAEQIDQLVKGMRQQMIEFGVYCDDTHPIPRDVQQEKLSSWMKAHKYFEEDVSRLRRELEISLRDILEATHAAR